MKDECRRRRKAEHRLIKTLEEADTNHAFTPVHRECLEVECPSFVNVSAQGSEFIAATTSKWWIKVYALEKKDNIVPFDPFSISEKMDNALLPNRTRKPAWFSAPHGTKDDRDSVQFIAQDVIGCVKLEISGYVSTWCVASGQCLESIVLRGVQFDSGVCKISNTEFVVGSEEGHLCFLAHEKGCNLRETGRIWKAHDKGIWSVASNKDTILTTSVDWSVRLWDAKTKRRLAILHHDEIIHRAAISDKYIVTCSHYNNYEHGELRVYRNADGYPLLKFFRSTEQFDKPLMLENDRILCIMRGPKDENELPVDYNTIGIVDIAGERVLARLKVGCRLLMDQTVLPDGRIVAVGRGGCRGVIATPPWRFRALVKLTADEKQREEGRRMCSLL